MVVSYPVLRLIPSRIPLLCTALFLCTSAHALEHITLANGFSYDCSHHERVGDRIRLYFSSDASYQEIPATAVTAVETLPDPPVPQPAATIAVHPASTDIPELAARAGDANNIDVDLLLSVIHAESGGRATAVSRTGAQGLMQLMPGTAHELGVQDAFQPDQNIQGGTQYLNLLLNRYDANDTPTGLEKALAAYNAGPAAVDRYHGIPPFRETQAYVARVVKEFNRRKHFNEHSHAPANSTLATR